MTEAMPDTNGTVPILVTGAHRSGTTWVGKMLAAGGGAAYISEPLNVWHRPGVLRAEVQNWYTYICRENEDLFLDAFTEMLAFQYHPGAELLSLRSRKDLLRMLRDGGIFLRGRVLRQRPLIKDPFAVFSIPWFIERLGAKVVVTIRHPAAFASSLKRLDWPFDFSHLLRQPLLMRDYLEPYREKMQAMLARPGDVIGQAALLWKMIYKAVDEQRKRYPDIDVVRHEDLSLEPQEGFRQLYANLGLPYHEGAERAILVSSSTENPNEVSRKKVHAVRLDSRANLANWKKRLDPEELERLRELLARASEAFYTAEEWEP